MTKAMREKYNIDKMYTKNSVSYQTLSKLFNIMLYSPKIPTNKWPSDFFFLFFTNIIIDKISKLTWKI